MGNVPGSNSPNVPVPKVGQMSGVQKPSVPGRLPGSYGHGAANNDIAPAQSFKVGMFDNGEAGETDFSGNGQHVGGW